MRNCLLVHVIHEEQGESTGSVVLHAINEHLREDLIKVEIGGTLRVGKPKQNKMNPKPIIIKFVRCNCRRRILFK